MKEAIDTPLVPVPARILLEHVVLLVAAAAAAPEESRGYAVVLRQTEAKVADTDDIQGILFLPYLAAAEAGPCHLLRVLMSITNQTPRWMDLCTREDAPYPPLAHTYAVAAIRQTRDIVRVFFHKGEMAQVYIRYIPYLYVPLRGACVPVHL